MPLISVVMSVYKESEIGIRNSIESILAQTYKDFEYIIILDDPNNLVAKELLLYYKNTDNRIILIFHEINKGLANGLNEAILISRGKYIARQDVEDISVQNRLQLQYEYLEKNQNVDIVGSAIDYIDENGKVLLSRKYKAIVGDEIKRYNPLAHPSLLIKRDSFFKYGLYKDMYCEDYDLWIRWYLQGSVMHNLTEVLVKYVQTDESKKSKTKHELKVTITCKENYSKDLRFSKSDYIYLYIQKIILFLPSSIIVNLFYLHSKIIK